MLTPALLLLALSHVACTTGATPCTNPSPCGAGFECLASRCVREGADPVHSDAALTLVEPTSSWLQLGAELLREPALFPVADRRSGATTLVLELPLPAESRPLESAFLVLQPTATRAELADVTVTVALGREGDDHRPPKLDGLPVRGLVRGGPTPLPLRVDVTALVRARLGASRSQLVLVLDAPSGDGLGVELAVAEGPPPRLELFFAP